MRRFGAEHVSTDAKLLLQDMDSVITQSLKDWAGGDATALDRIAPHVYPKLQELAKSLFFGSAKDTPGSQRFW